MIQSTSIFPEFIFVQQNQQLIENEVELEIIVITDNELTQREDISNKNK